jgi:hypothetical protein
MKNTTIPRLLAATALCLLINSCASTSQSGGRQASAVLVSESAPPANAEYLGSVAASDEVGYRKCESLYGALANQARSMGGNAVFYARGERRFTLFSWSAPTANGKAYRVRNPGSLSGLPGKMFGSSTTITNMPQRSTTTVQPSSSRVTPAGFGQTHYLPGVE